MVGKSHLQRVWGPYGSYCGQRNSASGATAALILGSGGASFNGEFEGTLVKGDEIYGPGIFNVYLYAGYTSDPYDENLVHIAELDELASGLVDDIGPRLISALQVSPNTIHLYLSDNLDAESAENIQGYYIDGLEAGVEVESASLIYGRKVSLKLNQDSFGSQITVMGVWDSSGNGIDPEFNTVSIDPLLITPHLVGSFNEWTPENHDYDLIMNDNGIWELTTTLAAGDYEYKVIESDEF